MGTEHPSAVARDAVVQGRAFCGESPPFSGRCFSETQLALLHLKRSGGCKYNSIHPELTLQNQEPTAESRCPLPVVPFMEVTASVRPQPHERAPSSQPSPCPHSRPCPYTPLPTALALSAISLWYLRLSLLLSSTCTRSFLLEAHHLCMSEGGRGILRLQPAVLTASLLEAQVMPAAWWSPSRGGSALLGGHILMWASGQSCASPEPHRHPGGESTLIPFIDKGLKLHSPSPKAKAGMGLIPHRIMEKATGTQASSMTSNNRAQPGSRTGGGVKKGGVGPGGREKGDSLPGPSACPRHGLGEPGTP